SSWTTAHTRSGGAAMETSSRILVMVRLSGWIVRPTAAAGGRRPPPARARCAAPPQLPAVLHRAGHLTGRYLDAKHRAALAGAPAHPQRPPSRRHASLPVPAHAGAGSTGRDRRRPLSQAADLAHHQTAFMVPSGALFLLTHF